jgi:hypothetical protein
LACFHTLKRLDSFVDEVSSVAKSELEGSLERGDFSNKNPSDGSLVSPSRTSSVSNFP